MFYYNIPGVFISLGYDISYHYNNDINNKLTKFKNICGTIHKVPENKTSKQM